jgi:hypothetical protein
LCDISWVREWQFSVIPFRFLGKDVYSFDSLLRVLSRKKSTTGSHSLILILGMPLMGGMQAWHQLHFCLYVLQEIDLHAVGKQAPTSEKEIWEET